MKYLKIRLLLYIVFSLLMCTSYGQGDSNSSTITMKGPQVGIAWGYSYGYEDKPAIFLPELRSMGVGLTKLYLFWQQIEPIKGQYQWGAVDSFLRQLKSTDEALIAVWSSSAWATKFPSQTLPASLAKSENDYYEFITELVKHCKGKIRFWQNDCEANNPVFWNGTNEEFISEMKIFYRAVKNADTQARVVMGGYDGLFNPPGMWEFPGQKYGLEFYSKAIKEAATYFDIFDLRLYSNPYSIPERVRYFKQLLVTSANDKPIICTEYNGPGFFDFPVNLKHVGLISVWQQFISSHDTAVNLKKQNPFESLYENMSTQPPQTQMFMIGCSKELDDKYARLQCRDIVIRNILAFSAGVQKTFFWDFWHNTEDKYHLITLLFGKNKVVEYNKGKIIKEYSLANTFKQMTAYLNHINTIKRINIPGKQSLYFFEITLVDKKKIYVVWEKRDTFTGEDLPATQYTLPWNAGNVKATDIFDNIIPLTVAGGNLAINVSVTPIFMVEK